MSSYFSFSVDILRPSAGIAASDIPSKGRDAMPRIWADERAVRQVTLNLRSNAARRRDDYQGRLDPEGALYLSIADTGPGIPPEEIPIVLSSFGRGTLAQKNAEEARAWAADRQGIGRVAGRGIPLELNRAPRNRSHLPSERVMDTLPAGLHPTSPQL
jgi:two-component system cell cycle sensor histidine kinase PleC